MRNGHNARTCTLHVRSGLAYRYGLSLRSARCVCRVSVSRVRLVRFALVGYPTAMKVETRTDVRRYMFKNFAVKDFLHSTFQ